MMYIWKCITININLELHLNLKGKKQGTVISSIAVFPLNHSGAKNLSPGFDLEKNEFLKKFKTIFHVFS